MRSALLLAILIAIAGFANATTQVYTSTALTSGTAVTATTSSSYTTCTYYRLTVPAGTGAVQIDLAPASGASYTSISVGFNAYPSADRDSTASGNSWVFSDNNASGTSAKRYFVCTYDPVNTYGNAGTGVPSGSSSGRCSGFASNMHNGGNLYICVSPYSDGTAISTSLTATTVAATALTLSTSNALVIPAASSTAGSVVSYKMWIPQNTTALAITTSSSSIVFQGAGLWSNAYTTGNSLSLGSYPAGQYVYLHGISTTTSAGTAALTSTQTCSYSSGSYSYSSSSGCVNATAISSGAATAVSFTSSGYQLYTMTVPAVSGTTYFYQLTVSFAAAWSGSVYAAGTSFMGLDSTVNNGYAFTSSNAGTWNAGTTAVVFHGLMPGTTVYLTLYSSTSSQSGTMTATFAADSLAAVVVGTTALTASTASATTSSGATTTTSYYLATPITYSGSNGWTFTVNSQGLTSGTVNGAGVAIYSSDFNTAYVTLGVTQAIGTSTSSVYVFNVPASTINSGSYYLVSLPNGAGTRKNSITVAATNNNNAAGKTVSASSFAIVVAVIATIFSLFF